MVSVVWWLVPRDFWYRRSIKDAVSLSTEKPKQKQKGKQRDSSEGRRSVVRPTWDVTPTARDLLY